MATRRRRFGRLLVLLLLFIGAAIVAAPFVPIPPLRRVAEQKLSQVLGRAVTIQSARLSVFTGPHLRVTGLTVQDPPEFGGGTFLRSNEVRAGISLLDSMRHRRLVINSMTLASPEIKLTKSREGEWSWATLGTRPAPSTTNVSALLRKTSTDGEARQLALLTPDASIQAALRFIRMENASVTLVDQTGTQPSESRYKNIGLNVSLAPQGNGSRMTKAKGELVVESPDDGESGVFKANLPFELELSGEDGELAVTGWVGPGPVETRSLSVNGFAITGVLHAGRAKPFSAEGQITGTGMLINTVNLSDRVARALKIDQIGDMNPGTGIASLEAAFKIDQGTINTQSLQLKQLDGLGDATSQRGSFRIESSLLVDYAANITFSPETTSRVKSAGTLIGLLATILETNNQLSVPINVTGDLRNPNVQVDVNRIF